MDGPFVVRVGDRALRCEDGWLVRDEHGRLWPGGVPEFDRAYTRSVEALVIALAEQLPAAILRAAAAAQEDALAAREVEMINLEPE